MTSYQIYTAILFSSFFLCLALMVAVAIREAMRARKAKVEYPDSIPFTGDLNIEITGKEGETCFTIHAIFDKDDIPKIRLCLLQSALLALEKAPDQEPDQPKAEEA